MGTSNVDLEKGLGLIYMISTTYALSKIPLSKAFSKIEPMTENLEHKHPSSLYYARLGSEMVFFQKPLI